MFVRLNVQYVVLYGQKYYGRSQLINLSFFIFPCIISLELDILDDLSDRIILAYLRIVWIILAVRVSAFKKD